MRVILLCLLATIASAETGVERLHRLDLLPRFHESVSIASISSHDRTGGNDDGFSGKYSFVRKEGAALVLADLQGPGVIFRIWTPTPTDDITEFYFDGEAEPRIRLPFRQLFTGEAEPFLPPLSGLGAGGFYTYVPIPYEKSCKIVVQAEKFLFYQINYTTYPESAGIRTYSAQDTDYQEELAEARTVWSSSGGETVRHLLPPNAAPETTVTQRQLSPGTPATIFETDEPGRIVGLRLSPASAFAGKSRSVVLRAYWDGVSRPAIEAPAGDLFGYAWGEPAVESLLLGTRGEENYLYLPMPYEQSALIELVQDDPAASPVEIRAEVIHTDAPRQPDEGKLHALWHRENPTEAGRPFTFLEAAGRGHIVGLVLQAQGMKSGGTSFFEGDDQTTIDGELRVHGTGSEDFFNGGWYNVPGRWNGRVSLPMSGCLGYSMSLARTGGYRFFIGDAYAYRESILQTIEHAPTENKLPTDHAAVTFFYADAPEYDAALPPLAARRVTDLDRIVFTPGWNIAIESFSIRNATLAKRTRKLGEETVRYLAIETEGEDTFGPHHIALRCDLPAAGRYRVSIEALEGPGGATVQLSRHENLIGKPVDLRASEVAITGGRELGVFDFEQGVNTLFFKLTDGTRFNLARIALEVVPSAD